LRRHVAHLSLNIRTADRVKLFDKELPQQRQFIVVPHPPWGIPVQLLHKRRALHEHHCGGTEFGGDLA
jgi:hypothetical protein